MKPPMAYSSDIAFTPTIKAIQTRKRSRQSYARMEEGGAWRTAITPDLAEFIATQTSIFLGIASADGQPYIQHRGGPAGFLNVLDDKIIAFADFVGNRQFITQGNLWKILMPADYRAKPEQVMLFTVAAWDVNCPQHIPLRFDAAEVAAALRERDQKIAALEEEITRLKKRRA